MAGNVNLIDPNNSNINNNITNGIPQYQDMYISVDLTAYKRQRTVLSTNINTDITKINKDASQEGETISFLGQNQDQNNSAHFNKFTTNYYDQESDTEKTYEGFGIKSIDVVVNSSYIPQIDIEFIDIRGLAFFNRKDSPYRILFDFPPPIFYLSFKGYYGKGLTYQMHLVKYNTEFKAETGNYHIKAQFIAITYAPLTDILYRYIIQAPLMFPSEPTLSSKKNEPPKNTFDLILKLENLYSEIPDKLKSDIDSIKYENAQKKLESFNDVFEILYDYKNRENLKKNSGEPILFTRNEAPDSPTTGNINRIESFVTYNEFLETFQTVDIPNNIQKKLFIGYFVETNNNNIDTINQRNNTLKKNLNNYKKNLITSTKKIMINSDISIGDIKDAEEILSETGAISDADYFVKYIGIDITRFYTKIFKNRLLLQERKRNTMNDLNQKINNMIQNRLGMLPTIYNIFEIILNDVDTFFNKLRNTSKDAEEHHNKNSFKKLIVNDGTYKDIKKNNNDNPKIYSFPLIIKQEKVCNQTKEVRTAPIDISARLDQPFPELTLVQEFIDSFIKYNRIYKQATLKDERSAEGNYKWIPFTPADSTLVSTNINSPYYGTDSSTGGDIQQPINLLETNKLTQIFEIFLKRFYILSQNALAYSFYNNGNNIYETDNSSTIEYVKLYAKSEAINLVNSVTNEQYAKLLKEFSLQNNKSSKLNNQLNGFYTYINEYLTDLYSEDSEFYTISNGYDMYRDKEDELYRGFKIINSYDLSERISNDSNDDFDQFIEENETTFWDKLFRGQKETPEENFVFSKENVIFRKDRESEGNDVLKTKFIASPLIYQRNYLTDGANELLLYDLEEIKKEYIFGQYYNPLKIRDGSTSFKYYPLINKLIKYGNKYFKSINLEFTNKITNVDKNSTSILDAWTGVLSTNDNMIYDSIIKYENGNVKNPKLTALIYLSNFGYTLSTFNSYPYNLNVDFFSIPSIVELPYFVQLYMGALVGIEKGDEFYNEIYDFFTSGSGIFIESGGMLIFADIHDINKYLSNEDKDILKQRYETWFNDDFNSLASSVDSLYRRVNGDENSDGLIKEECLDDEEITIGATTTIYDLVGVFYNNITNDTANNIRKCKLEYYEDLLTNDAEFSDILDKLVKRVGFAIFNEITFRYIKNINNKTYTSLNKQNQESIKQKYNNIFFSTFFNEISKKINKRLEYLQEQVETFKKSTGDEDILTQTYYSFKNLNDKWLSGLNKSTNGYPFKNERSKGLISQFAFVDRAMNPIGDTIIDPKALIDAKNSPDTSVFSVLSQLLSLNGFEFFPLQNFLKFTENEWEKSFEINTSGVQKEYPVFVCMYIGGAASYPSNINLFSPFEDDGIVDLENPNTRDFLNSECEPDPDRDQQVDELTNNGEFLNEVRAFRVRYGEQNQNMFFDFGIDSKEYPETNESIQILSRLAGDNKEQAPVPKGQNLYNIYENRAYKATVTGFGNAMIQPTQYFQLENVPLFNGAYVILTVEHNITPNKMTTKFSGTKLLKYPMPRVKNPASIVGFDGGSTTKTNANAASIDEVLLGVGTADNPNQAKYNSMYTFKF